MLYVLALSPVASGVLTSSSLRKLLLPRHARAALVGLSVIVGAAAAVGGFFLWYDAIEIACEGRYECPL